MPRFICRIFDGASLFDPVGSECRSAGGADCAIASMDEVLQRDAARIAPGDDWRMDATDEPGLRLPRPDVSIVRSP